MARNIPTDANVAAMRRLVRAVRDLAHKAFRVPVADVTPGEDTNLWISSLDGRLYWRSPNGTIQAVGTGTGPAPASEPDYATGLAVLPATGATSYPAQADGLLCWGAGRGRSIVMLEVSELPADAEILHVEVFAYSAGADAERPRLHFAPIASGHDPSAPIVAVSQGSAPRIGGAWITVARVFGEMWRDGTASGFAVLPDPADPYASGYVTGPATPYGMPPLARVHYQIPV